MDELQLLENKFLYNFLKSKLQNPIQTPSVGQPMPNSEPCFQLAIASERQKNLFAIKELEQTLKEAKRKEMELKQKHQMVLEQQHAKHQDKERQNSR
ncbi:unnamed protein product [Oppiella nova]|uniref:Uncharacterized protein n=1 Tax=Oppiella nova TaxID=334625 RepID=A0A7R9QQE3_9ACAR|nr:unnamed protein product [Oppiella nova]CAG2170492.1 unnamed protein product [Oppiella nova]